MRVGCPMWAHRPWVGRFLPSGTKPGEELAAYARILPAVEGNTTFYAVPETRTVARWSEQAPSGFRFVFKLPRPITHELRLRHTTEPLGEFLGRVEPLADRMGPVMIQLPPSFDAAGFDTLRRFVSGLPAGFRWAVEARHPDYFAGGTHEGTLDRLLSDAGMNRVILDTRSLYDGPCETEAERAEYRTKPQLPVRPVATAAHPIVRFIGQSDPDANRRFWQRWLEPIGRWVRSGHRPYFFMHTPENVVSPGLARWFHADLGAAVEGLEPLPDPPDAGPTDVALF